MGLDTGGGRCRATTRTAGRGGAYIRRKKTILGVEPVGYGVVANQDDIVDGRDAIRIKKMILGIA